MVDIKTKHVEGLRSLSLQTNGTLFFNVLQKSSRGFWMSFLLLVVVLVCLQSLDGKVSWISA